MDLSEANDFHPSRNVCVLSQGEGKEGMCSSWKLINCIYGAYIFLVRDVEFLKRSIKYVWCSMILVIGGFKVFFSNSCDEIDF